MSKADVERFVIDAKRNGDLQKQLKDAVGVAAVVEVANRHGSRITEADMRDWLREDNTQLTEKELEAVAGGLTWGLKDKLP
ncbi:MAG: Nif11-like leader peptide family RiPP precursor [Terriglobales bacterium]